MQYLGMKELQKKFSVSRDTIWRWRKEHRFPAPVEIAKTERHLWIEAEVDQWATDNTRRCG